MQGKFSSFGFSLPPLPKEMWMKFQEIRKLHGLTQAQCFILGIVSLCKLGEQTPALMQSMAQEVKDKY